MRLHRLSAAVGLAAIAASTLVGCVVAPLGSAPYYGGTPHYGGTPYYGDTVAVPPPPPPPEVIGVAPVYGQIWIGGFWNWVGARHVWIGGRWEAPRPGYRWVPHEWRRAGPGWQQRPGYWSRGY